MYSLIARCSEGVHKRRCWQTAISFDLVLHVLVQLRLGAAAFTNTRMYRQFRNVYFMKRRLLFYASHDYEDCDNDDDAADDGKPH
jgi:hypothetical protein